MSKDIYQQRILILDFGSQYTQLIARRVREMGVYSEIHPWQMNAEQIQAFKPSGIILSGGPHSTTALASSRAPEVVFNLGVPVLGICYGMQTMALQLGGQVKRTGAGEFGYAQVKIQQQSFLLQGIEDSLNAQGEALLEVWMSHGDQVTQAPEGFIILASSQGCHCTVMADESRHLYGIQFHPEVTHTLQGQRILTRFVRDICGCEAHWTPKVIIEEAVALIRQQVGEDQVILGLSGGVDSSVTALLLHRAIGQQLICVFVDNGLLRLDEGQQIIERFGAHFGLNLVVINAEARFLSALQGISDPEAKRKIIGREFIEVFEQQAASRPGIKWLAQGTIYPDVIESAATATGQAAVIKSHHNVGGLPDTMQLKLLEPLKTLFKDEVRQIGLALGLPHDMLYRHPFPGPGLGVRVMGEVKKEYCDLLRQADAIFVQELHQAKLYYKVSQAFAVFLPVRSVGVMGDNRRYDWIIALRAVETSDFMTAQWAKLPYDFLAQVANRIVNEVAGISRVVYDISGKPPATIEWE